jgi:hypothetical protein
MFSSSSDTSTADSARQESKRNITECHMNNSNKIKKQTRNMELILLQPGQKGRVLLTVEHNDDMKIADLT